MFYRAQIARQNLLKVTKTFFSGRIISDYRQDSYQQDSYNRQQIKQAQITTCIYIL